MQAHLFVGCDGDLFDTRNPAWSRLAPLRPKFRFHHREINTVNEYKATLRAGAYAWPGGYPLALITSDGAALCFDCAKQEARNVFWSIQNRCNDGWRVVACDIIEESGDDGLDCICDHCGKPIGFDVTEEPEEDSRFETVTGTAPSHWAVYFINGDASGMEDDEIAAADAFAEWLGGNIVSCEDADFLHYPDSHRFWPFGADCQTYTALIDKAETRG